MIGTHRFVGGLALLAAGCALPTDEIGGTRLPLVGGQPSTAADDAAVMIRAGNLDAVRCDAAESNCGVCSGRLLTPRLVLTAHHCVTKNRLTSLNCAPDGTALGDSASADLTLEQPEHLAVYVGHEVASLRKVAVSRVIAGFIPSVCDRDVAFLVLAEPALEVRTPLRRAPVRLGETFAVAGWGFTLGTGEPLPDQRQLRTDLRITEVGPGPETPVGMFATGGASLCQGDSGAVALVDGAAVGVYSRQAGACSAPQSRSFLQGIGATKALTQEAFAAVDEEPWYIEDDEAADAGETDGAPARGADAPPESGGCSSTPSQHPVSVPCLTLLTLFVCSCLLRRRMRHGTDRA